MDAEYFKRVLIENGKAICAEYRRLRKPKLRNCGLTMLADTGWPADTVTLTTSQQ